MIENKCMYFGVCGGCQIQGVDLAEYKLQKMSALKEILTGLDYEKLNPIVTFSSGIRRKATLKVDYGCNIGFFKAKSNEVVPIQKCPLLLPEINALLLPLRKLFKSFVKRSDGSIVVVKVENGLTLHFENINIMLLDKQKIKEFCEAYNILRLTSGAEELYKKEDPFIVFNSVKISYPPKTFLQPAVESEQKIVDIVLGYLGGKKFEKSADVFCGLGLFSFYLKDFSKQVFAFDCDEDAITHLKRIAHSHHFDIDAKKVDLFSKPLKSEKLNEFDLIVLDPPRDGAKKQSQEIAKSSVKTVVYVSCNPLAFKTDAKILIDGGYRLKEITPIDQFPNTKHLELVCLFERA